MAHCGYAEYLLTMISVEAFGVSRGLAAFYFLTGEMDKCADWLRKEIEQRHMNAVQDAMFYSRSGPFWPALAKMLNLPESTR